MLPWQRHRTFSLDGATARHVNKCRVTKCCSRLGTAFLALILTTLPAATSDTIRLMAFGDSLTAGYGLAVDESFTVQLERALRAEGYDIEVINAGVSGDTTAGGLARLDWALADAPDLVLLELGANDGLRGLDPNDTRANLAAILDRLTAAGMPTLLAGMLAPPNLGREYGAVFDGLYPDLAETYDVPLYPFFLDGVAAEVSLNQDDGIHPNAEGVAVIVDRMLPMVIAFIESSGLAPRG